MDFFANVKDVKSDFLAVYNQHFQSHGGAVVNIVCDMFRGFPMMSHTGAARAAVDNLTKYAVRNFSKIKRKHL